ncbi:MAG: hypothetical protein RL120_09800 [Gammaproteobacteria bacterium]
MLLDTAFQISTFGEDETGELYLADIGGSVYQLVAPLSVSPASGVYFNSQFIDLGAVLRVPGVAVSSLTASLDGIDVSAAFDSCVMEGSLDQGGLSLRCPDIPLELLQAGEHRFSLQATLSNGQSVSDTVHWTVLDTFE